MDKKRIQEMAQRGLKYLVEDTVITIKPEQIEIFEEGKLIESEGKSYKARGVLKGVPVTKFTENANGRVYGRELEEKIITEGSAEGTLSLAGHPETGAGEPDKIVGVWHNYKLGESHGTADWYLTGSKGQDLLEVTEAGGKLGISRSGYGEFMEDGKTVRPDTYVLERLGDCVVDPSQGVYATKEHVQAPAVQPSEKNAIKDSTEKVNILEGKVTNKTDEKGINNQENKNSEVQIMDKLQEASFKNTISAVITNALKNENLMEALDSLKRVNTADVPEIKAEIQEAVEKIQKKLKEETEKLQDNLTEKAKAYDDLIEKHTELSDKFETVKKIVENNDLESIEDVNQLKENYQTMKEDIKVIEGMFESKGLKKFEVETPKDVEDLVEDTFAREHDIKKLKEDRENMMKDIEVLQSKLSEAETHIDECQAWMEKKGFEFEESDKADGDREEGSIEREGDDYQDNEGGLVSESKKSKKSEKDDDEDEDDDKDDKDDKDEKDESKKKKEAKKSKKSEKDEDDEDDDKDDKDEKDESKKKKENVIKYKFKSATTELAEEIADDKIETPEVNTEKLLEEKINVEISKFCEAQIKKYPAMKEIKDEILKSKSLIEAVNKTDEFKENGVDMVSVKTISEDKPAWLKGRM